ncbi:MULTISPECIES: hypothetical protein [unclassified Nocardiopsis]|uniref:hypothetical protein n=1 Tax=unclassified Nocardiopsis TaxID=2649073 RepID=UPI001357CAF7|nr:MULTISPECIES: hypothetical protein [unclassified Nocardiopsis]
MISMLSIEGRGKGGARLYRIDAGGREIQSLMLCILGFVESNSRNEVFIATGCSAEDFYETVAAMEQVSDSGAGEVRAEINFKGQGEGWIAKPRPAVILDLDIENFKAFVESLFECFEGESGQHVVGDVELDVRRMKRVLSGFLSIVGLGEVRIDLHDKECGISLMDSPRGVRTILSSAAAKVLGNCALEHIEKFPQDGRQYIIERFA